jgi:type I restriction enzyme S subunit
MPQNWKTYNLGDLVDLKQGLAINKKTDHLLCGKGSNSIPLFKIRDLLNDTIEHYVKKDEIPKQCIANKEDLIYSRTGQVGFVFKGKEGCVHNNCFKIIPDERLDREFLYHFLRNPNIRQLANDIASGSVQKDLNHTAFKSIKISVPNSINDQRAIASILSALDDKIELNLQMNKTLEEMAMALYKHWFVDFGPFKDDEFVESELGMIPKGWTVKKLGDVTEFLNGYAFKSTDLEKEESENTFHVFKMGHINKGGGLKAEGTKSWIMKSKCTNIQKYVLKVGDILMSMTDMKDNMTILGHTALMNENDKYIVNQRVGLIRMKNNFGIDYPYIYITSNFKDYIEKLRSQANSGVQVNLSTDAIKNSKILIPETKINYEFNNLIKPLFKKLNQNSIENQSLKDQRDYLLPKLISGEIHVNDINKNLHAVV